MPDSSMLADVSLTTHAAARTQRPQDDCSVPEWRQVIGSNLDGAFHCMRTQLAAMLASGSGEIVNISSGAAVHPPRWLALCSASKAALIGLTREHRAPTGRIGAAAEVAEAVVWLCSDRAFYIHGVDLLVDGGEHAFSRS